MLIESTNNQYFLRIQSHFVMNYFAMNYSQKITIISSLLGRSQNACITGSPTFTLILF
ncbi:hypothetical protein GCM10007876_08370 [Litoribrevibacter albus]|uniref:Uncharacterized protein n=1 Tax=Litoribrevibacter albus TaxID=1473156 RepID=A0AA37W6U0_9GAMM|nr:hypothetical protein GCM10007876_08370 [Litoribrevibacter albus]